jgi:hypothetical protein
MDNVKSMLNQQVIENKKLFEEEKMRLKDKQT